MVLGRLPVSAEFIAEDEERFAIVYTACGGLGWVPRWLLCTVSPHALYADFAMKMKDGRLVRVQPHHFLSPFPK